MLLVTGPFKVNGVPLRRVNARYVIATKTLVNVGNLDEKVVEKVSGDDYFAREKKDKKKGEDAFFKQGEKAEVSLAPIATNLEIATANDDSKKKAQESCQWSRGGSEGG